MSNVNYKSPYTRSLPWSSDSISETIVRLVILALFILLFLAATWKISTTTIPELNKKKADKIPDRLIELVAERTKRPIPPPVKPKEEKKPEKKDEKKPEEKKPEEKKPEPKPQETKPEPTPERVAEAKEQAAKVFEEEVGSVMADVQELRAELNDALSDLGGLSGLGADGPSDTTSRDVLTSRGGTSSSGGVAVSGVSRNGQYGGGSGKLGTGNGAGTSTKVQSGIASAAGKGNGRKAGSAGSGGGSRSDAQVRQVFNSHSGRMYNIYRRALRKDPSLEGSITFKLKIESSGSVSSVSVASSEIDDDAMLRKLKSYIRTMNFGPADGVWNKTYSVTFFPT